MIDFFFFVKTLFLTLIVVLLLQIQVGSKTVEGHMHEWMEGSVAASFLGNAAHGGAIIIKDTTAALTKKMKSHIGFMHRHESSSTKASRMHWDWSGSDDKNSGADDVDAD